MFYRLVKAIGGVVVKILFKFEVNGIENIPKEGGYMLCANHISNWDPFVMAVAVPRQINFMGKMELFKNKLLAFILEKLGVFPVDRGKPDISAIKTSFRILSDGELLGVFPEGTRVKEYDIKNAKPGAAMISIRTKSPIIPIHIDSNYEFRKKVIVNIGEPVNYHKSLEKKPTSEDYQKISEDLLKDIYKLKN